MQCFNNVNELKKEFKDFLFSIVDNKLFQEYPPTHFQFENIFGGRVCLLESMEEFKELIENNNFEFIDTVGNYVYYTEINNDAGGNIYIVEDLMLSQLGD